jgi:chromosome segregation ATPase
MCKKVGIVALGVFAAMCVLSFTKLGSYVTTATRQVRKEITSQVPIDFEIKRLKHEVEALEGDLKNHRSVVAGKLVAVSDLEKEVKHLRDDLSERKERMAKASAEIDSGAERVVYNGREYPVSTVTKHLRTDLEKAKRLDADIKNKDKLLEQRRRAADLAEQQLSVIASQKQALTLKIEELETEYEAVKLAATESKVAFDDSRLSAIKQDLEALQSRVSREKTELDLAQKYEGKPVVETPSTEDVNRDVKTFLNGDKADNKVTTESNRK